MSETRMRGTYGMLAEFGDQERLLEAARRTRAAGYTRMDAYTPYPVEGLAEALGFETTRVPSVITLPFFLSVCVVVSALTRLIAIVSAPLGNPTPLSGES